MENMNELKEVNGINELKTVQIIRKWMDYVQSGKLVTSEDFKNDDIKQNEYTLFMDNG